MAQMLDRREYIIISVSIAVLGSLTLIVGFYYLFIYLTSDPLASIVFYFSIWVIGIVYLMIRLWKYLRLRAFKTNSS
jgi:hypothetical protein